MQKPKISIIFKCILFILSIQISTLGQVIFQETFETDGDGSRYTLLDKGLVSGADLPGDQDGPIYWEHNFNVPVVGVVTPAAARRAVIMWHHNIVPRTSRKMPRTSSHPPSIG